MYTEKYSLLEHYTHDNSPGRTLGMIMVSMIILVCLIILVCMIILVWQRAIWHSQKQIIHENTQMPTYPKICSTGK